MAYAINGSEVSEVTIEGKTYELHVRGIGATLYPAGTGDDLSDAIAHGVRQRVDGGLVGDYWLTWMSRDAMAPHVDYTGIGIVPTLTTLFRLHRYCKRITKTARMADTGTAA